MTAKEAREAAVAFNSVKNDIIYKKITECHKKINNSRINDSMNMWVYSNGTGAKLNSILRYSIH